MSALSALLSSMPQYHCGLHTSLCHCGLYAARLLCRNIIAAQVNPSVVVDICGTNRPNGDA